MGNIIALLNASLMLQTFQAISFAYLALPISLYFYLYLKIKPKNEIVTVIFILTMSFLFMKLYTVGVSFLTLEAKQVVLALVRDFFTFPLFFVSFYLLKNKADLQKVIFVYVIIVFLGALSLVYQQFFGALAWLDADHTRGGLNRYASLLGALPIFGVAGALALILLDFVDTGKFLRFTLILFISIGLILTLQKAAIANLLIVAFIKTVMVNKNIFRLLGRLTILGVLLGAILLFSQYFFPDYARISMLLIGIREVGDSTYVGNDFLPDIIKRLTGGFLVGIMPIDLFTGLGYLGGAGIYGLSEGHSGHNAFVDLLLTGGALNLLIFMAILMLSAIRIYNLKKSMLIEESSYQHLRNFLLIFVINMPLFSGILVNPSLSGILWLILGYIARSKKSFLAEKSISLGRV